MVHVRKLLRDRQINCEINEFKKSCILMKKYFIRFSKKIKIRKKIAEISNFFSTTFLNESFTSEERYSTSFWWFQNMPLKLKLFLKISRVLFHEFLVLLPLRKFPMLGHTIFSVRNSFWVGSFKSTGIAVFPTNIIYNFLFLFLNLFVKELIKFWSAESKCLRDRNKYIFVA